MSSINENNNEVELSELMSLIFPGHEGFLLDSVTPAITGEDRLSFMIVCNDEAKEAFLEIEEIYAQVFLSAEENIRGKGLNLNLRFNFTFPVFELQFFATVDGDNSKQQKVFAELLTKVEQFIVWIVDEDKSILKILQVSWDKDRQLEKIDKILSGSSS